MNQITDRILEQIGDRELLEKLLALPKSDLNSLLLALFRRQAETITPPALLRQYGQNRFAGPGTVDAADYHRLETDLLELAGEQGIRSVLLSPSAPFGSCSAFGCVDQNNVVSAVRGTETLADPTNLLAIDLAQRLKSRQDDGTAARHCCTTARVVRAQAFAGKRLSSHFGLFSMVSSGRDSGSYRCEQELLVKQLRYYKEVFFRLYRAELSVKLRKRNGYPDGEGFFERMTEVVRQELPQVPLSFDLEHPDNRYYQGINFKLYVRVQEETFEVGDGGFVDWIGQMTGNGKERCLISGIGIDRLLTW